MILSLFHFCRSRHSEVEVSVQGVSGLNVSACVVVSSGPQSPLISPVIGKIYFLYRNKILRSF